jgi:MFS family permease
MVLAPLTEAIIETLGWRAAFLLIASFILFGVLPVTALYQRRSPREVDQYPDGPIKKDYRPISSQAKRPSEGKTLFPDLHRRWGLKDALYEKAFWYLALVVFCNGFVINMLLVHQVAYVVDLGYSEMLGASLLGLVGLGGSGGGIICGLLSDRFGRERGYTLGSSAALTGMLLLLSTRDNTTPWMLYAFAILYGVGCGSMGPMTATTTGDLFPGNSLGRILAIQSVGFGAGGALGPYVGGHFHDLTGSYLFPLILSMLSIGIGIFGIWMAAPRHRTISYLNH